VGFPVKECKASLFAAAGTCKVAPETQCTKVNGEQHCTITAPKYMGSPIPRLGPERYKNLPICEKLSQAQAPMPNCRLAEKGEAGITKEDVLREHAGESLAKQKKHFNPTNCPIIALSLNRCGHST
jgi:hypothetical protein